MFDYLQPRDGAVVDGLESKEIIYAKNQPEYNPLRTLVSAMPDRRVWSRWTLTPEQRKAVAEGADIFLEYLTFGRPLQPLRMAVSDGKLDLDWVKTELLDETVPSKSCPKDEGGYDDSMMRDR
jgi:hypothetical protein